MLIEIKKWRDGSVIFSGEYDSIAKCVEDAVAKNANLSYADLSYANLSSSNLRYADLSYANLRYANLSYADLSYADLSFADLRSANLSYADLSYANLSYADLSFADLSYADLSYADLRFANLSYVDLSSANLDKKYCYISLSPIGSENGCLWVMADENGILKYNRGCFCGTKEEFLAAVAKKHAGTKYEKIYIDAVNFIENATKID